VAAAGCGAGGAAAGCDAGGASPLKRRSRAADAVRVRATRAIVASLGAGVTVAIAASACLLVVSAVVAFNGWPELGTAGPVPTAELPLAGTPGHGGGTAGAPVAAAASALPAAPAINGPRSRGEHPARRRAAAPGAALLAGSALGAAVASAGTSPVTIPPSRDTASPHGAAGDGVRTTAATGSAGVRQTATPVGAAVQPVSPQAGQVVEQTADAVAVVVDRTGTVAGDAVDQLAHP
jgi:hypothetical protein